jgi:hypothetical protein
VIVAVTAIRMMQMAIYQVIDVPTVGHCLVSAVRTVLMVRPMCLTIMSVAALRRVLRVDVEAVLINVAFM